MTTPETNCPPASGLAEGQSIALEANAVEPYPQPAKASKKRLGRRVVAFRDVTGRIWQYSGKRGRVLAMLATSIEGVTQWDCLPWHTRLGGSIHVLRQDGLEIETALEGEFNHARYWLRTRGALATGGEI